MMMRFNVAGAGAASVMTLAACLFGASSPVAACSADSEYLGSICFMATAYCPDGYLPADGRLLKVKGNEALFSLLGAMHGGDGRVEFGLPNLSGRTMVGSGPLGGTNSRYVTGQVFGVENVTLNSNNLPQHVHPATFKSGGGSATVNVSIDVAAKKGDAFIPGAGQTVYLSGLAASFGGDPVDTSGPYAKETTASKAKLGGVTGTISGEIGAGTVSVGPNTTAAAAIFVRDPSTVLTACIAVTGLYPTRP